MSAGAPPRVWLLALLAVTATALPGESSLRAGKPRSGEAAPGSRPQRPHILFVVADDYGWGGFGVHRRGPCHGDADCEQGRREVQTPVLDALADGGILLDRHYAFRICSPSRSSLQSGRLAVHVNIKNAGVTYYNKDDPVSGYAGIPRNMTGMAEKMRSLGYRTHMVGKWDAGMATPEHTPHGRGYDSWLGYFQHANDYWTKGGNLQATGELDNCLNSFTDFFQASKVYRGGVRRSSWLSSECNESTERDPPCYEEHIFKRHAIETILAHNTSDKEHPLFMFYAFHLVHTPLQVPIATIQDLEQRVWKEGGGNFSSSNRRLSAAMVLYMDQTVGELVAALKAKSIYEDTLIVFISDNGGPIYEPGSANNYPLRGGKFSDMEGGIRTNALVSGGFVPASRRGTVHEGVVSIADWYGTLCAVGGGSSEFCLADHKADEANAWIVEHNAELPWESRLPLLKPVDSVLQWDFIVSGQTGRGGPLHLSEAALLEWPMKLVIGTVDYGTWQGPLYPNCSTISSWQHGDGPAADDFKVFGTPIQPSDAAKRARVFWELDCSMGCLFNVSSDPTEHNNLASTLPEVVAAMNRTLQLLNKDNFLPDRGSGALRACEVAMLNGGYYGPFVDALEWYSKPTHPVHDPQLQRRLLAINTSPVQDAVTAVSELFGPAVDYVAADTLDTCLPCQAAAEAESWDSQGAEATPQERFFP